VPTDDDRCAFLGRQAFEQAVSAALDEVPSELMDLLDNVVFLVEDHPAPDLPPDLLGIYEGLPRTERTDPWGAVLPDRITVFRVPTLATCRSSEEVQDEVAVTVVHEIAHHFGMEEDRLHALGWG